MMDINENGKLDDFEIMINNVSEEIYDNSNVQVTENMIMDVIEKNY